MTRRCPRCGVTKPETEFCRNRSSKTGYGSYCKPCHKQVVRDNYVKNHGSVRSGMLKIRYGVDATQVEWMILQQGGACALCGAGRAEHVDHDHASRRVRGILCFNCKSWENDVLMNWQRWPELDSGVIKTSFPESSATISS